MYKLYLLWRNILTSDEAKADLLCFIQKMSAQTVKHRSRRIMLWEISAPSGSNALCKLEGILTNQDYTQILQPLNG